MSVAHSGLGQVLAVFRAKLRMAGHTIASVRYESKLKVAVITVAAICLWLGAFVLFYLGFDWLIRFGSQGGPEFSFGDFLMRQTLGIFSLSVFLLLIFSNVLVSFATFYRSHEVVYLLQGPISYRNFFYARFFECLGFSSWSLAFLGSPLILAYGLSIDASLLFYGAAVLFFLPFVIVPAAIGCLITLVLVRVFPRIRVKAMVVLGCAAVGLFFLFIRYAIQGTEVTDDTLLQTVLDATARTQSAFLPSYWASQGILLTARY